MSEPKVHLVHWSNIDPNRSIPPIPMEEVYRADDPAIVEALRESRVLKGCKILLYALKRIRCAGNGECKFSVHDSDCPKGIADKAISRYDEWLRVCIEKGK